MKGVEKQVLRIVRESKKADGETLARKMLVSADYTIEICEGLIRDGCLKKANHGYALTKKGARAVTQVKARGPIAVLKGGS